jgi:hypothetical protein
MSRPSAKSSQPILFIGLRAATRAPTTANGATMISCHANREGSSVSRISASAATAAKRAMATRSRASAATSNPIALATLASRLISGRPPAA